MLSPRASDVVPAALVVDLDGTLVRTDLLVEGVLALSRQRPWALLKLPLWLMRGRAFLKARIADQIELQPALLPYNQELLAFLWAERAAGRRIILATAASERVALAVSESLGLFDEVIASDRIRNGKGSRKLEALSERLADVPFDYIGNAHADLPVWRAARHAFVADPSPGVLTRLRLEGRTPERVFTVGGRFGTLGAAVAALRPHHWLKNLLLFVPLVTADRVLDGPSVRAALVAFVAFSLVASATYLINDLVDLEHDRTTPGKRKRPFAAGRLSPLWGIGLIPGLLGLGWWLAAALTPQFGALLLLYFVTTLVYSLYLKRRIMVDVLTLAGLYTLRVIAGAAAIGLETSAWLAQFSVFLFVSLALVKRTSELVRLKEMGISPATGRGYRVSDLEHCATFGSASACTAVLVLALYVNGPAVAAQYENPYYLWLLCPCMLYWLSRLWLLARRGRVHEDPLVHALRDRVTYVVVGLMLAATFAAR